MTGFFEMVPGAVDMSAAAEAGISEEMAATTAAGAAALTGVLPMAADTDSIEFAAALNAAGRPTWPRPPSTSVNAPAFPGPKAWHLRPQLRPTA